MRDVYSVVREISEMKLPEEPDADLTCEHAAGLIRMAREAVEGDKTLVALNAPLVELDAFVSTLSIAERNELGRVLDAVVEKAARVSGYLDARGVLGCGDNGHAEGVKHSNRKAVKVRRALGYTVARRDVHF